jgi:hypothetical protein
MNRRFFLTTIGFGVAYVAAHKYVGLMTCPVVGQEYSTVLKDVWVERDRLIVGPNHPEPFYVSRIEYGPDNPLKVWVRHNGRDARLLSDDTAEPDHRACVYAALANKRGGWHDKTEFGL